MSFFFFKQKTAYEITNWSSDVCSSDLSGARRGRDRCRRAPKAAHPHRAGASGGPRHRRGATSRPGRPWRRSEERRVGEEGRSRGGPYNLKKKKKRATDFLDTTQH